MTEAGATRGGGMRQAMDRRSRTAGRSRGTVRSLTAAGLIVLAAACTAASAPAAMADQDAATHVPASVPAADMASAPPEADAVTQIVTAAHLADWGRRRGEPGPLIMAARMMAETPLRPAAETSGAAFLTWETLLTEAEGMAAGNPSVLDAVARVRNTTRGVRSSPFGQGPIFQVREIKARETYVFELEARGGVLRVAAIGDGDSNIDMSVRDAGGTLVCQDGRGDHYPVCTVVRAQPGKMRIDIVNRGQVWTKVQILSN